MWVVNHALTIAQPTNPKNTATGMTKRNERGEPMPGIAATTRLSSRLHIAEPLNINVSATTMQMMPAAW